MAEGPPDVAPTGGFDYGQPGIVHEVVSARPSRVHTVTLEVPSAPGFYSLAFYPMNAGQTEAVGSPFEFDYEINCHALTRPLAKQDSLILFFAGGAGAALLVAAIIVCIHHRSAAKKAALTKEVSVTVRRADGTVETYKKKVLSRKERLERRKRRKAKAKAKAKNASATT